ncbi:MAG: hypothetical protein WD492_11920 [Alkalispirochaeta sp.]
MADDTNTARPRNGAALPIVTNTILLLCTAGILWWAITTYREQIRTATLEESRFVTMEWNLLQQLKAQTDQQLSQKDKEIAELRRRYQEALRTDSNAAERDALQTQIRRAEEERRVIVSQRLETNGTTSDAAPMETESDVQETSAVLPNLDALVRSDATPLMDALQIQLTSVRTQLAERDSRIDFLQDEIERLQNVVSEVRERSSVPPAVVQAVERSTEAITTSEAAETAPMDTVDLLNTRTLIKAILSAPEVRTDFPGLVDRLDQYTATVESRAHRDGRTQSLHVASTAIETAARELRIPLSHTTPPDTLEGYTNRLVSLIQGISESIATQP